MIDKRRFPASLGAGPPGIASGAVAQIRTQASPPKKEIPRRKARPVKPFKAPEFHPNCSDKGRARERAVYSVPR